MWIRNWMGEIYSIHILSMFAIFDCNLRNFDTSSPQRVPLTNNGKSQNKYSYMGLQEVSSITSSVILCYNVLPFGYCIHTWQEGNEPIHYSTHDLLPVHFPYFNILEYIVVQFQEQWTQFGMVLYSVCHYCILTYSFNIFTVRKWSCGKVMFLHLSVSHSVHGGGGRCIPACTGQTPLPSACWDTHTPLPSACWDTPPAATAADGTYPTGMISCSILCTNGFINSTNLRE